MRTVSEERGLPVAQVRLAIDFYGEHAEEVDARIALDEQAAERVRKVVEGREAPVRVKWLFDEMFPPECAKRLCELGHDALSVHGIGLAGHGDEEVFSAAISQGRVPSRRTLVTSRYLLDQHLSRQETCVPVVFLHRDRFPRGGSMADKVAALLDGSARDNPEPYLGTHWPKGAAED